MSRVFRLKNDCSEVPRFHTELSQHLSEFGVGDELIHDTLLVCEEVLVNTILHGYPERSCEGRLEVAVEVPDSSQVLLTIRDDAVEFNPLQAEERDLNEDRIGGWGLPLLDALTSHIEYRREAGFNVLTLECVAR